jgi:hypothetical protein
MFLANDNRYQFSGRDHTLNHSHTMSKETKRKTARGAVHRILDRACVARVLESAIRVRYDGNRATAAARSGVDTATLFRLNRQVLSEIRHDTYNRITKTLLKADEVVQLDAALESPLQYELGRLNLRWTYLHTAAPGYGPDTPAWELGARALMLTAIDRDAVGSHARERWREYVNRERHAMWERLQRVCWDQFDGFRRDMLAKRHQPDRILVAWERVLAPLLERSQSGFIELSWCELTDRDFARFVRIGLQRERILLKRPPLGRRAAAVAREAHTRLAARARESGDAKKRK